METKIGENAGTVWNYLSEAGEKSLKEVKKACKLTEKDMYAALGWLAREGKIEFQTLKDDIKAKLL